MKLSNIVKFNVDILLSNQRNDRNILNDAEVLEFRGNFSVILKKTKGLLDCLAPCCICYFEFQTRAATCIIIIDQPKS